MQNARSEKARSELDEVGAVGERLAEFARLEWRIFHVQAKAEWERRARLVRFGRRLLFVSVILGIVAVHQLLLFLTVFSARVFSFGTGEVPAQWIEFGFSLALVLLAGAAYHLGFQKLQRSVELSIRKAGRK